jgi:hypothetical protein
MSQPRFLADNDLNDRIVTGLLRREPSATFTRVRDVGLADASDNEVLAYASRMSFSVVSHDVNTMPAAAAFALAGGRSFPGLFLIRQTTPIRVAIESLLLVWSECRHEEWRNHVVFLPF